MTKRHFESKEVELASRKHKALTDIRLVAKEIAKNPSTITESVGVLSLTDKPDNLLMWAHYAQSHKGFVIELDSEHPFFTAKISGITKLKKVTYVKRRALTTLFGEGDDQFRVFFLKSLYWEYESEWRLIRLLEDADKKAGEEIYLFKLPEGCITSVILGLNMKVGVKTSITDLLKTDDRYTHVKILEAAPDYQEDRVNINPVST